MRRSHFLLGSFSGLVVVGGTQNVFARALADAPLPGLPALRQAAGERVLVVINLQGGNDGLNCIVPHGDPNYYRVRPSIGVPQNDVLDIDGHIGFNPVMKPFKDMYDKHQIAVVQNVGYPDPDHSHFRSTEIWQTAVPEKFEHTGWLGRYLDDAGLPKKNLFNGVAVAPVLPEAFVATHSDVPVVAQLNGYGLISDRNAAARTAYAKIVGDGMPFSSPYLGHVAEIEDHAQKGSEELPQLIAGYKPAGAYPATPLGRSLALAAQIIGSNKTGTRVIYVQHGSFDTHVNQKATQDRLLVQLSDAVKAFYDDLGAHGNEGRVLTMTFSEFGRRIEENASRGTDHGEASPLFLIGGGVKGGVYGAYPDLVNTSEGNVKFQTDFRQVYATIIERWMGLPSDKILQGRFQTIGALA